MNAISARNPHGMLPIVLDLLFRRGVKRNSRNGPVLQLEGPTLIEYERPMERVMFWPERNANPFFHFMESMWMLSGRRDVKFVAQFSKGIAKYSDDGVVFNGAYGWRWRLAFGQDQLAIIAARLKVNADDRRQVLVMWSPEDLFSQQTVDVPCNTHAYFARNSDGALDLTVCNRSNDLVWGCLGANAVHFSYLLEYMAGLVDCPVGKYYQFTNNLHGYLDTMEPLRELTRLTGAACPYELGEVEPARLFRDAVCGRLNCDLFALGASDDAVTEMGQSEFWRTVVVPMRNAWVQYKADSLLTAIASCDKIAASDWRKAAREWLARIQTKRSAKQRAQDDGVTYD